MRLIGLGHTVMTAMIKPIHDHAIRVNVQVSDDEIVTVSNIDFCGVGRRAYDLASYLLMIRSTAEKGTFTEAFIQSSRVEAPLPTGWHSTGRLYEPYQPTNCTIRYRTGNLDQEFCARLS